MTGVAGRYDESDVRTRPSRRGSRPRTKQRPEHADAEPALVTAVDRGRYTVLVRPGTRTERLATAMRARELGRSRIVCGDRVEVVGDTSGRDGTLARIVRVTERTTVLRRTADDTDAVERTIVANADQLVVVTALADPPPRIGMIDRCIVAAYEAGMDVLLCLTKSDLAAPDDLVALYTPLGVDVVVTRTSPGQDGGAPTVHGLAELRERLRGRMSVLVGHSGVGKSTLVNALVPDAARATGDVNVVTGRGRHTSSSAVALRLPDRQGWVIDTPGVRSFGLAHVQVDHVLAAFTDLAAVARERCPRGCTHTAEAPDCALDEWVEEAEAAGETETAEQRRRRVDSLRRLLAVRLAGDGPGTTVQT